MFRKYEWDKGERLEVASAILTSGEMSNVKVDILRNFTVHSVNYL